MFITENGTHYGVEVMGKVFDNLSAEGLSRELWVQDFNCRSGQFVVDEVSLVFLLDIIGNSRNPFYTRVSAIGLKTAEVPAA